MPEPTVKVRMKENQDIVSAVVAGMILYGRPDL
jgi:hypothetical protein